jgi:hypothetical protein
LQLPVLPVVNAMLPRPNGGILEGIVLDNYSTMVLMRGGVGGELFLCPWDKRENKPFHVGVTARCRDLRMQVYYDECNKEHRALHIVFEGRENAKAQTFTKQRGIVYGDKLTILDLKGMRAEYPVLCGAGWQVMGGHTEMASPMDIRVVIYGIDYESGAQVQIGGNLGGLVSAEQAHTVEHAVIRSLGRYALCTAKTLIQSMMDETYELKQSVEWGIRHALPEAFGVTQSGACGNPLSNTAQIYMAQEFTAALEDGRSVLASIEQARQKTMSRLTGDLGITTQEGVRILQGLKKGMFHDDTPISLGKAIKVLSRFPISPWR